MQSTALEAVHSPSSGRAKDSVNGSKVSAEGNQASGATTKPRKVDDLKLPFHKSLFNFRGIEAAKAACLAQAAINCLYTSQAFYSSTLLYLTNQAVGCVEDEEIVDDCQSRILYLQPGSFIFSLNITSRALIAIAYPIIGAAIDATPHRRRRLLQVTVLLLLCLAAELMVTDDSWIAFLVLDQLVIALTQLVYSLFYAYFLELRQQASARLVVRRM